jgi:hypothetical protein
MSSKKVLKKNVINKIFVFLLLPVLKRYYLIYEDKNEIVLLKKGKNYRIDFIMR